MVIGMQAMTTADNLSRGLYNALLWASKSAPWDMGLVSLMPDGVRIITSDSYSTTMITVPGDVTPREAYTWVKVTRDGLTDMLTLSTKAAKGRVSLSFAPGESLTVKGETGDLVLADLYEEGQGEESWDDITYRIFVELLADRMTEVDSHKFMVNPKYLRKVAQTKKEAPDVCADFWVHGDEPVFIRIGEFSQTIVQPVDRTRHADVYGEAALW
ncbi:hypothetical protein [Nonomuraea recticatena]|uniref:Uncharacterized protein n=1 Tax=Nonomuraea recticatena TaxID=46178 RepID=A0ABP6ECT9_9ACTN